MDMIPNEAKAAALELVGLYHLARVAEILLCILLMG